MEDNKKTQKKWDFSNLSIHPGLAEMKRMSDIPGSDLHDVKEANEYLLKLKKEEPYIYNKTQELYIDKMISDVDLMGNDIFRTTSFSRYLGEIKEQLINGLFKMGLIQLKVATTENGKLILAAMINVNYPKEVITDKELNLLEEWIEHGKVKTEDE